ncbi:hypothetical protein D3C80_1791890 [compost metagenome]
MLKPCRTDLCLDRVGHWSREIQTDDFGTKTLQRAKFNGHSYTSHTQIAAVRLGAEVARVGSRSQGQ